jgi:hypothetical protein
MSKQCDAQLTWPERLAVRMHLLYCRGCARLKDQLQFLRAASRRFATGTAAGAGLSRDARDRIRARLQDR